MLHDHIPLKIRELSAKISDEFSSDIIFYSGHIESIGFGIIKHLVCSDKKNDSLILILKTAGGNGEYAYKIGTFLQERYSHLAIFAPDICVSAGTLLALGAHELIVGADAQFGPIDQQERLPNEFCVEGSSLALRSALDAAGDSAADFLERSIDRLRTASETSINFELAAKVYSELAKEIIRNVASKIDPLAFGHLHRCAQTGIEYGTRLATRSGIASADTVRKLALGYPDHGFVIDRVEAEELFNVVTLPSLELMQLAEMLLKMPSMDGPSVRALHSLTESSDGRRKARSHTIEEGETMPLAPGEAAEAA